MLDSGARGGPADEAWRHVRSAGLSALAFVAAALEAARASLGCSRRRVVRVGARTLVLTQLIAEGSSGFVWAAADARDGARFAVKEVRTPDASRAALLRAEVAAHRGTAGSPHVLALLDVALGEGGGLLLLPLLPRSLGDATAAAAAAAGARPPHGPPPGPRAGLLGEAALARLAVGLAAGLAALHAAGRAHRDLCPRNVLLDEASRPLLADLGSTQPLVVRTPTRADVARAVDTAAEHSSPPYRPPELWDADAGGEVGPKADVWSLGATLFCAAFGFSPAECVRDAATGGLRLVPPSHVRTLGGPAFPDAHPYGRATVALLTDCLALDPAARPGVEDVARRAQAIADALEGGAGGAGARGEP